MRDRIAFILLVIGFWWPTAWLLAWLVGRSCDRCRVRAACAEHQPSAEILHHPGSRGFK